ncbi:Integrase, catalytic core protein [Phytophthora megakarya]|uniref:Integrase, catalytic core protein n=1 Tax=Phytophthora megakarya TaxID=4795 RepID=A0A225UME2_9STRA|nr:Integrase, catalytic core protein [Phytophthora megakarya]
MALAIEKGFRQRKPVQVWCDSRLAISSTKNPGNHKASKHIEIKYLFTRDLVTEGRLVVEYCPTASMLAHILTKALPTKQYTLLRNKIEVKGLLTAMYTEWEC